MKVETKTLNFTICFPQDGGVVIYENIDEGQPLVFGGNHGEAVEYLNGRMAENVAPRDTVRQSAPDKRPASVLDNLPDRALPRQRPARPLIVTDLTRDDGERAGVSVAAAPVE